MSGETHQSPFERPSDLPTADPSLSEAERAALAARPADPARLVDPAACEHRHAALDYAGQADELTRARVRAHVAGDRAEAERLIGRIRALQRAVVVQHAACEHDPRGDADKRDKGIDRQARRQARELLARASFPSHRDGVEPASVGAEHSPDHDTAERAIAVGRAERAHRANRRDPDCEHGRRAGPPSRQRHQPSAEREEPTLW